MESVLEVISGHPVFAAFITRVLARDAALRKRLEMRDVGSLPDSSTVPGPKLFLVDSCSYSGDVSELCCRFRRACTGNKFVCLLPSLPSTDHKKLELLCSGVDGIVCLRGNWENELRRAVAAVLDGDYWFPRSVLREYITKTAGFFTPEQSSGSVLTAREIEVTNLVLRKFSNREISERLSISVRTVKFHVSNVLHKVGIRHRSELLGGLTIPLRKQGIGLLETVRSVARPPCPQMDAKTWKRLA
ncbi:MAG TPA: response regulator transcription factor [Candidatus Acidoferrum sp.]|nr:response regulator transcription factor [Candidatus Acidoferrum sp.]